MFLDIIRRSKSLDAQFAVAQQLFGLVTRQADLPRRPPAEEGCAAAPYIRGFGKEYASREGSTDAGFSTNLLDLHAEYDRTLDPLANCFALDLDADYDLGWKQNFPEATMCKRAYEVLLAQMLAQAKRGNWHEVTHKARCVAGLGHALNREPVFLFVILGMAARKRFVEATLRLATEFRVPDETLAEVATASLATRYHFDIAELIPHDLYFSLALSRNPKDQESTVFDGLPKDWLMRASLSEMIEVWTKMSEIFQSDLPYHEIANRGKLISATLKRTFVHIKFPDTRHMWGGFCTGVGNDEARRRALYLTLERLRPGLFSTPLLPDTRDPYSEEPMLSRNTQWQSCIYSIGSNRIDDGGPPDGGRNLGSDDVGFWF